MIDEWIKKMYIHTMETIKKEQHIDPSCNMDDVGNMMLSERSQTQKAK